MHLSTRKPLWFHFETEYAPEREKGAEVPVPLVARRGLRPRGSGRSLPMEITNLRITLGRVSVSLRGLDSTVPTGQMPRHWGSRARMWALENRRLGDEIGDEFCTTHIPATRGRRYGHYAALALRILAD